MGDDASACVVGSARLSAPDTLGAAARDRVRIWGRSREILCMFLAMAVSDREADSIRQTMPIGSNERRALAKRGVAKRNLHDTVELIEYRL